MSSTILQKARDYEEEHSAAISAAERPAYHLTPYVGWMNDPNGFSFYHGKYHLFYQYNPYATHWGPMHWGHAVSTDLLHWEHLPCAIAPDSPSDNGPGCFSGSATEMDDGRQLLMYTSVVSEKQPNGEMRDIQTQSVAVGDGLDYEKPACNPVLTQKDLPEGYSKFDFRDPKIWKENDTYYLIVGNKNDNQVGQVVLCSSKNLTDWKFETILASNENGDIGTMWECPDFFRLNGQDVLLLSPQGIEATDEKFINQHNTGYFVGNYLEDEKRFEHGEFVELDNGHDLYATQTMVTPDGRRVMVAWMNAWDSPMTESADGWCGAITLPRELTIRNNHLYQSPVAEVRSLPHVKNFGI